MMKCASAHRATKMTAAADGALFVGVADHTNPQYTAGSDADYTKATPTSCSWRSSA